jgi:hypothetical protein
MGTDSKYEGFFFCPGRGKLDGPAGACGVPGMGARAGVTLIGGGIGLGTRVGVLLGGCDGGLEGACDGGRLGGALGGSGFERSM